MITWIKNTPVDPKNETYFRDLIIGETFWCAPWIEKVVLQKIPMIDGINAVSIMSLNGNIDGHTHRIQPTHVVKIRHLEVQERSK